MNPLSILRLIRLTRHATGTTPSTPRLAYWFLRIVAGFLLLVIVTAITFALLESTGLLYRL